MLGASVEGRDVDPAQEASASDASRQPAKSCYLLYSRQVDTAASTAEDDTIRRAMAAVENDPVRLSGPWSHGYAFTLAISLTSRRPSRMGSDV